MQITIFNDGLNRLPRERTFRIMPRSIISVALKSAMTPSFSGLTVLIFPCVLPCIWRAWLPMATNLLVW